MLTHKHVDVPFIIRIAGSSAYRWMTSLEPLRKDLQQFSQANSGKKKKRGCCGKKAKAAQQPVKAETVNQLARNPQFKVELVKLKKILAVDQLIVSVGALHTRL